MNPRDSIERSIVVSQNGWSVSVLDQRQLPWRVERVELTSAAMAAQAIREMWVRGAPLIGATAAYGLCLALREDPSDASLERNLALLLAARPTAVNLRWALERVRASAQPHAGAARVAAAYRCAAAICDEDVRSNRAIGQHGLDLIRSAAEARQDRQRADALQCRSARHSGSRDCARTDLPGARVGHPGARVGG
jgi:methylthioribose-1-phosphate isomerase